MKLQNYQEFLGTKKLIASSVQLKLKPCTVTTEEVGEILGATGSGRRHHHHHRVPTKVVTVSNTYLKFDVI